MVRLIFLLFLPLGAIFSVSNNSDSISLIAYLGLAFSAGFLSLLTPCVFPMIPITVSYFTKRNENKKMSPWIDAIIFSVAIILTFTILGFFVSLIFGASGISRIASNPWLNLFIGFIFLIFSFNLFGFIEIQIPAKLLTKFEIKRHKLAGSQKNIWLSTVMMAFIFTLTTFTCTVPFLGTVLVKASSGKILLPVIGMLAYGSSFALPFFFLALFPNYLRKLPKSGDWLSSIKVILGFLELAASLKFFSNVDMVWQLQIISRPVFLAVWSAIGFISCLYLLGLVNLPGAKKFKEKPISLVQLVLLVIFLATTINLTSAIGGRALGDIDAYLPPPDYGTVFIPDRNPLVKSSSYNTLKWYDNLKEAKIEATKENKLIFIDFTGYTCTNCRWMEQNIFSQKEIQKSFSNFILVKLYTDGSKAIHHQNQKYQEKNYKTITLPFYAVIDANAKKIEQFPGYTRDAKKFLKFLEKSMLANEDYLDE